ncbi:unnamed protein product [Mytilus edulis]|uniref:Cadherin-like beta-sandwich-like domain-containing protein n=1 Tax=Mytilus edulis TaxID=6550 RepID=A0A8S3QKJ9_MYTED|nr:unnamed protein product [Mytilus edulis]
MDDCNLDKLVIKPGKLSPAFHKDTTEYNVTLASNVEKIHVDPLTSDTGASYCISGSDGGKDVPLKEGQITDIKIEVTSEDCTIKNYFIHAKRLSAKDATLSDLKLSDGDLSPEFSDNVFEYSCLLPCNSDKVTVTPIAPDPKNAVLVCKEKPGTSTPLNVGETNLQIEVTSADGSNKQTYSLDIIRKPLPRYVKITDDNLAQQYECPISLSSLYRPITIKANDEKHTYSAPNIDAFTRTSKIDPLSGIPLTGEWRIVDYDLDKKMANAQSCIPLTYGGTSETKKYSELGSIIDKTNVAPKPLDVKDMFKDVTAPLNHTVQVRKWEKQMQQCFDDLDDLKKGGEEFIQEYYKSLPKPGESKQYDDGCTPLDYLQRASHCIASAIKLKPKDPNLHLHHNFLFQEHEALPSFNLDACKESSRDEECAAICKLRGVDASSAPIALQLKAIDQEYHHLIENGQSVQADPCYGLFAWKSKQASQEGMAAQKATDEENPLGQAYLKYMDALVIDEAKAVFNFHVGRLLVIQGNFSEAAKRLEPVPPVPVEEIKEQKKKKRSRSPAGEEEYKRRRTEERDRVRKLRGSVDEEGGRYSSFSDDSADTGSAIPEHVLREGGRRRRSRSRSSYGSRHSHHDSKVRRSDSSRYRDRRSRSRSPQRSGERERRSRGDSERDRDRDRGRDRDREREQTRPRSESDTRGQGREEPSSSKIDVKSEEIKPEVKEESGAESEDDLSLSSISSDEEFEADHDKKHSIDALDIDWASLQQDVRPKPPVTGSALNRFKASNVFAQIGVSKQYAGEELFNKIQNECIKQEDSTDVTTTEEKTEDVKPDNKFRFKSDIAVFHSSITSKNQQRKNLLRNIGPFRRALCARRDLEIRRQLCKVDKTMDHIHSYPAHPIDQELYKLSVQLFRQSCPEKTRAN